MSGSAGFSGLISGMDTESLIRQIMQLERQPAVRLEDKIADLGAQREAVRSIRTQLTTLRNRAQDFRLNNIFDAYLSASSEETVLNTEISSSNPSVGSFRISVNTMASATEAVSSGLLGGAIDPNAALDASGINTDIQAGSFTINGQTFSVDPTTDSLQDILDAINSNTTTGVTATYDAGTDKVIINNTTAGDASIINFSSSDDDTNFLSVIGVTEATQSTNGSGSTEVTSTSHLGALDPGEDLNAVNLAGGAVTTGTFSINGISITVDSTTDSLSDVISRINNSDAGVSVSYDSSTDGIRVISSTLGSRTVRFGAAGDTSNFLDIMNLTSAVQTAGDDAQFTVNDVAYTRNTNEVSDAINGVTLNFLSTGESTVTVSSDNSSIVEAVQEFIDEYNTTLDTLRSLTDTGGTLSGDGSIRSIESWLRSTIFNTVSGLSGDFSSLVDIGITTGDEFDSSATPHLELDEDVFREALRDNRENVQKIFANDDDTGIGDLFYSYLDEATKVSGYLNARVKSNGTIDRQITILNDQIDRMDDRLAMREKRMRSQFTQMEQMISSYQSQASSLSGLSNIF